MNPNGPNPAPDLRALLDMIRDEVFASLNCIQICKVVSFDAGKGTVQAQIAVKRVVFNQAQGLDSGLPQTPNIISYPVLIDCPAFALSGGQGSISMPIESGDTCLVLFNDRDMSTWFATGSTDSQPETARMHSLSDGFALVGFRSLANLLAWSTTDIRIRQTGEGKINLQNSAVSMLGLFTDLLTILTLLNAASGNPATGQIVALMADSTALLS